MNENLITVINATDRERLDLFLGTAARMGFPMVLIVGVFECEDEAGIEKKRPHACLPYK